MQHAASKICNEGLQNKPQLLLTLASNANLLTELELHTDGDIDVRQFRNYLLIRQILLTTSYDHLSFKYLSGHYK